MSDRVLRGTRLGAVSYESDRHTEFAPRLRTVYDCPNGHETAVPFAAEAEIPSLWECPRCGAEMEWRHATWQCPRCRFKLGCCEGESPEACESG